MKKNYLKIAWRNLVRNKVSSIINMGGLAIGLSCVVFISLYIGDELSYDRFFKNSDRIFRVNTHELMSNSEFTAGHTPPPVGAALVANIPEVESYTRIYQPGDQIIHFIRNGQKGSLTEKSLLSVDSNFLQVFSYPLIAGDRATCLNGTNSVVLTERAARKYFGNTSPIGKNLVFDMYGTPFTVTAVLKDLPSQSSLQFDVLQSNLGMPPVKHFNWSWIWLQMGTYVKLRDNIPTDDASIKKIEAKFPAMIRVQAATAFKRIGQPFDAFIKKGGKYDLELQRLADVHLYSANIGSRFIVQSDIKYVYIFSAIGLFIILLACVNFMNLATAQSAKRAKEVGIRKVLGSARKELIMQFMAEALVYTLLAAFIAVIIVSICLPAFNQLAAKSLSLASFFSFYSMAGLLSLIIVTSLLAGSYPAFFLTSFKPAAVLKGSGNLKDSRSGFFTRNALVVFQFTISTVLIICTMIVYKQLLYNQSKDLGFNKENILVVADADRLGKNEESFRQELLQLPEVANASISTSMPAKNLFNDSYVPESTGENVNTANKDISLSSFIVDEAFVPTLKLKMAAGRNFSKDFKDSASVILNENAVTQLGFKDPIGKTIIYPGGNDTKFKVIGVVKDFNIESLHSPMSPFALFYTTSKTYDIGTSYIAVKIKPGDYSKAISSIQNKWKGFMPDNPFEYSFLDQEFDAQYSTDQTVGKVFSVFTFLSLTVACLGLLGLAMYTAERRTKEIGIRKVLGASVQSVVSMLSKDFLKLVILASFIAFPLAWYAMNQWLQSFAYPTTVNWWVFALAGAAMAIIALLTVSFQAIKAALTNPVESLRSE
jgi:putative ABC transport system permease protein